MCDFAADAKAAEELMVGRTLSVARVRELNAKDYFYQMLKDNPEMLKIYPGIENELLDGAIDCHIHAFPDFVHRSQDMIQIAIEASKCGMRVFIRALLGFGIKPEEVKVMLKDNPAKLMWLDE